MSRAMWNGAVLAESDRCEVVEGNQYFPPDSINRTYFKESATHTVCSWKGTASYYDVVVNGQTRTGTLPGTIRSRKTLRSRSRATLLSGAAWKSNCEW